MNCCALNRTFFLVLTSIHILWINQICIYQLVDFYLFETNYHNILHRWFVWLLTLLTVSAISNMSIMALILQYRRYFVNSAITFTCDGCVGEYTSKQFGFIATLFKTIFKKKCIKTNELDVSTYSGKKKEWWIDNILTFLSV